MRYLWVLAGVMVAGCTSTTDVLHIGPNAYTVSSTADGMRTASSARQNAIKAGAEKCTANGQQIEVTGEQMAVTRMGIDTTVSVNFRCKAI
jgi:outer membrane murein-binding lipoprotein Lpp